MAKTPVYMPKFGMTMVEAEITEWYVSQGDEVSEGDPLLSIETEKTTTDIEAPADGFVTKLLFEEGEEVPVGTILVYIADTEEEAEEDDEDEEIVSAEKPDDTPVVEQEGEEIPRMRRIIGDNMKSSLQNTAQLTHFRTIRVDKLAELKSHLEGISYNDLFMKAYALALKEYEKARVQYINSRAVKKDKIDIGLAVALDDGLIVPAIRNVDQLTLSEIADERKRLVKAARENNLSPEDTKDAVGTLSSLGAQKIDFFTPILNPPETVILGIGRIVETAGVEDGKIVPMKTVGLSLTFDHQVLDGKDAADFLNILAELLENPSSEMK